MIILMTSSIQFLSAIIYRLWSRALYLGAYGGGQCTRCANCDSMSVCHDPACKPQQAQSPPPTIGRVLGSDNYDKDGVAR